MQIPTYEYKRVSVRGQQQAGVLINVDDTLEELGREGWNLVAGDDGWMYLRRQTGFTEIDD